MQIIGKSFTKPKRPTASLVSLALLLTLTLGSIPTQADSVKAKKIPDAALDHANRPMYVIALKSKAGGTTVLNNQFVSTNWEINVDRYGLYYYRLGRFMADKITKVAVDAPNTPIWQYSTNDSGSTESSNPYQLVFVNSQKAYLLRYGVAKAWIVNPSTTTEAGFKTGELDLSAYADADGVPEMVAGVIANGKLFVILQRLDSSFCPSNTAYVAVFDVASNTEIDTGLGSGDMKGIPLSVKNPQSIQYLPENNTVYVQGVGSFPGYCNPFYEYTGGIETINPQTYATSVILDDGDEADHPYGVISGMLIASTTKGYFVGYDGWQDNTLYEFNASTGEVVGALHNFKSIGIASKENEGEIVTRTVFFLAF